MQVYDVKTDKTGAFTCYHCNKPIIFNPRIRLLDGKSLPMNPDNSPHLCLKGMTSEESDAWIIDYLQERVAVLSSGLKDKKATLIVSNLKGNAGRI